jgi:hypothetical protein
MDQADRFSDQRLRAPSEHGQSLIHPAATTAANSMQAYREQLSRHGHLPWAGKPWAEIVSEARQDLLKKALQHSSQYLDTSEHHETSLSRIVLLGHQPELFHPGVWFKNFFAHHLARQLSAVCINLLIDNATLDSAAIQVPAGNPGSPGVETVAFDRSVAPVPFESRDIQDLETFHSFGDRTHKTISHWITNPLVDQLWPLVIDGQRATGNLGLALARGRHQLEQAAGIKNLDVPLSALCESESFDWFVSCILCQLPRFQDIHNSSLEAYRQAHRIRSKSHPVPVLESDDPWLEAPFWIWSRDNPQRRPLFVSQQGNQLQLTDRDQLTCSLEVPRDGNAQSIVEQLAAYRGEGICIRPRALTTTLYARLVLGDLFIHGIGGGRYDQLTNVIVERFFELDPPDFLTVTATLQLPIELPEFQEQSLRDVETRLREIRFSPELYLSQETGQSTDSDELLQQLVLEKETLLGTVKSGQPPTATWHQDMQRVNEQLQVFTARSRAELENKRNILECAAQQRSYLGSREFSFCLFPQETLCPLLLALSREGL